MGTLRPLRLGASVLGCALVLLVGIASASSAYWMHFFNGPEGYADSRHHTYCSSESSAADRDRLDGFIDASMLHLSRQTVMTKSSISCSTSTDFYWFATNFTDPDILATVECKNSLPGNKCDRFRMQFNEDHLNRTNRQVRHTACHEISHTVGSSDGLTSVNGCFPQSRYSDGTSHVTHEIRHIDDHYQP